MKKIRKFFSVFFLFFMLLGTRGGYLALWGPEDPLPVMTFPLEIRTLPPADQVLLQRGIRIQSHQQLLSLLEDYL